MGSFPYYPQMDGMDCGPACLQMIVKHYGRYYPLPWIRSIAHLNREGVSLRGIGMAAERMGLRCMAIQVPFSAEADRPSLKAAPYPFIVHWEQNHFVVVFRVSKRFVWIADPARGKIKLRVDEFLRGWLGGREKGIVMLLEPTPKFYEAENEFSEGFSLTYLLHYLRPFQRLGTQMLIGLVLATILSLIFPFLTQAIVDTGIANRDIGFIYLILIGQMVLFVTQLTVRFVQNWILLHIGTRLNVALISDFLVKLMRLPMEYFDTKVLGDLLQRIDDHRRIETFLTQSTLSVILSAFNLIAFSIVMLYYSVTIFLVFAGAAALYFGWIVLFLRFRRKVDIRAFQQQAQNQERLIEIIQGMHEIKLQGSQLKRRWQWAEVQAKLFRVQMTGLRVKQWQEAGASFINQGKDILITVIAATGVIRGELSLGMLVAIQYITGQLNGPLNQMVSFIQSGQDAKISFERLGEIHGKAEEDEVATGQPKLLPTPGDLVFDHVSFRYSAMGGQIIKDLSLTIPSGKVTAIVGESGSGKTTLLKLLLGFYPVVDGKITVGGTDLQLLDQQAWRDSCGVVMQDGYVFSDTIANNIAESSDYPEMARLKEALHVGMIDDFVGQLPLGLNTTIGASGNGISQGQRQRLLIARAVYKDPDYLFFDEATNALDASNERGIVERLDHFFRNRTVITVAHRLSTVKNAHQIVVLDKGQIAEIGNHAELVARRGAYYTLIKDQLELGS